MTSYNAIRSWILAALALGIAALGGCGRSHNERLGSETHFLSACVSDAECGALSCRAGACTLSCEDDGECSPISSLATCVDDAAGRACQVACTSTSQCEALSAGLSCSAGVCSPALPDAGDTESPVETPSEVSDAAVEPEVPDALGCNLDTGFADDHLCLRAPAPEDGIQLHLGPSRYDEPLEVLPFVLDPGDEVEDCWSFQAPNTTEIAYAQWESSARNGQHHAVVQIYAPDPDAAEVDLCDEAARAEFPELIGELPILSTPRIQRAELPPENTAVAFRMPAGARVRVRLHSYNFEELPRLRELWVNLYFADAEPAQYAGTLQVAGGTEWSIAPGSERTAEFECPIPHSGRLLGLRANIVQSTRSLEVWLRRANGELVTLLTQTDSLPETVLFDSITQNPVQSAGGESALGAHSGPVWLEPGDTLQWQCRVMNDGPGTLVHMEDHSRGAMCDLIGATTGGDIRCALP